MQNCYRVSAKQNGRWVTLSRNYAHQDDAADYAAEHTAVTGEPCKVLLPEPIYNPAERGGGLPPTGLPR